jgi:hypothetical protein
MHPIIHYGTAAAPGSSPTNNHKNRYKYAQKITLQITSFLNNSYLEAVVGEYA